MKASLRTAPPNMRARIMEDLRIHQQASARYASTVTVHYGQSMGDGTCIMNPNEPIIDQQMGRDHRISLFYKRCDGSYKNSLGQNIRKGIVPRVR
ncbi:hypothetical protein KVT40_005427 [Elsinoe batatas]|uniref:Uncharacterized protein n=1 Tax=Elsinoe batatas TaxID=2601811 RepID=A0A8K0KZV9_9PEZI|nr:hypothetical protein KVT40_005427 [Elsinoe batatas]